MQASWSLSSFTQVPFDIPLKNACHFRTFFREKKSCCLPCLHWCIHSLNIGRGKNVNIRRKNVFLYDLGGTDTYKLKKISNRQLYQYLNDIGVSVTIIKSEHVNFLNTSAYECLSMKVILFEMPHYHIIVIISIIVQKDPFPAIFL